MSVNFTLIQATDVNITGVLYRRPGERFTDACVIGWAERHGLGSVYTSS